MSQPTSQPAPPYVVRRPRASDAVGRALRDVYVRQPLPKDMVVLLARLNGNGGMRG